MKLCLLYLITKAMRWTPRDELQPWTDIAATYLVVQKV